MTDQWRQRTSPARLERRFEFDSYDKLRDFLDRATALCEREGYYPDMGFGRGYVNMTIHIEDEIVQVEPSRKRLAEQLAELSTGSTMN